MIFDTNVRGLLLCTQEVLKLMKNHQIDGHIININRYCYSAISPQKYMKNVIKRVQCGKFEIKYNCSALLLP